MKDLINTKLLRSILDRSGSAWSTATFAEQQTADDELLRTIAVVDRLQDPAVRNRLAIEGDDCPLCLRPAGKIPTNPPPAESTVVMHDESCIQIERHNELIMKGRR